MISYIFDVDGVITDPVSKDANQDVLKHILKILEKGDFVALNTGRSFSWTKDKILTPLIEKVQDSSILKNMFIVCEFGNVLARFENNEFVKRVLDDPLPEDLQEKMKKLAAQFSDSLFYDESKETMISLEMKDGFDVEKFEPIMKDLEEKVSKIVNTEYVNLELRVETNQIALDIQYDDAGKHLGAERIEDFMLENMLKPSIIYMFGDNPTDSQMAEELQGTYEVKFIYVGDKSKLDTEKLTCDIIYPVAKYTAGTLEFLGKQD